MRRTLRPLLLLSIFLPHASWADGCHIRVEANDMMQFSTDTITVPTSCEEIEVTLIHTGTQDARVMGHDWVLVRARDVAAVANAGMAAGAKAHYLPANDPRIIAATGIVGGGQTASVTFKASQLQPGGQYAFFCSTPGHSTTMKGRFVFGGSGGQVRAASTR
jgi:azurin